MTLARIPVPIFVGHAVKYPNLLDKFHEDPENFCPKGAESLDIFNRRVDTVLNKIIADNLHKRLIIVTHGEVIQAAVANALNIPHSSQFKLYVPTGSATQISYFEDFASLVYYSYIPI